uniref:Uncharacterized protein n=1 Tax=Arcella intermedia TaxID=1963864 RepID=A0A6B2LWA3_9EUKA
MVLNKANIDIQLKNGATPLFIASQCGHLDVVKYLVLNKANIDIQFKVIKVEYPLN